MQSKQRAAFSMSHFIARGANAGGRGGGGVSDTIEETPVHELMHERILSGEFLNRCGRLKSGGFFCREKQHIALHFETI